MKIFALAFMFLSLNIKAENACPIESDVNEMYSLFFSVAYKPDEVDAKAFQVNYPDKQKSELATVCLIKAAPLGNCDAIKVAKLYYETGFGAKSLGINKDILLAKKYKEMLWEQCKPNKALKQD